MTQTMNDEKNWFEYKAGTSGIAQAEMCGLWTCLYSRVEHAKYC